LRRGNTDRDYGRGGFEWHLPKTVGCEKISKVQLTLTEASPGL